MISVGSRDAKKGLALGFDSGGVGGDMEETELEEGEALSYHDNDDYDESIDPDVALSYIDEKLQDVLGHFQKDFEGGVSAENLGAKFGGYGSFLPTYQRSPVWSHPRTPAKVQNYSSPRSPNNSQLEVGLRNFTVSSTTFQSLRPGSASAGVISLPAVKPPSLNNSVKQEVRLRPARSSEELDPKYASTKKKSCNLSDQKTLKVRIKVGSNNLSLRKNAAIYSGLGLDDSPSSSLDESPSGSEGMSREDAPYESPTSILQIMTSFPVHGNLLLSPLPEDLLHLTEKGRFMKDGRSTLIPKGAENSRITMNGSDSVKKIKPLGKSDFSAELNYGVKNGRNGIGMTLKKEQDIDALACEELVSNTLKLPIFTNEVGKGGEDKKPSFIDNILGYPRKDSHRKEEKSFDSVKADSDVYKVRKGIYAEPLEPPKLKANQKATWNEQDGTKLPSGKEPSSLGVKKKSKGGQIRGTLAVEDPKESSRLVSSSVPKSKKSTNANSSTSKNELDIKVPTDLRKTRETYMDFFGDTNLGGDNPVDALETSSEDRLKNLRVNGKGTLALNDALKEKSSNRKIHKPPAPEAHPKAFPDIPPHSTSGPTPDGAPSLVGPHVIKENWVLCDMCGQWRLLPFESSTEDLPEKWLCSMQHWLPGMNRCEFTEDETKRALLALYQIPAAEDQNYLHTAGGGGVVSGAPLADVRNLNQSHQNYGLHAVPGGGKKKILGLKETTNATSKDGANPVKKNPLASVKNKKLNDSNQSPLLNKFDSQQLSKSGVEKHRHKHKVTEHFSDGGDTRNLKMKSKRDHPDQDSSRAYKKVKTETMHGADEDWKSDHGGANGKVGASSSSGFAVTAVRNDQLKYGDRSLSKERYDTKDKLQVPAKKPIEDAEESLDLGNCDNRNVAPKKRRVKEGQDPRVHLDPSTGHHLQDRRDVEEEFSENDYRKDKKARVSKSDGKESDSSRGKGRSGIKGNYIKNQQPGQDLGSGLCQRSLEGIDSVQRDLGSAQAATSSSSKISSSHKSKTRNSFQEVKGSPVESVSSSPMRILDPDKLVSARRNIKEKDETRGAGFFSVGSPKKCSDGEEDGGSDRSRIARKEKTVNVTHRSMDSMLDFQDRSYSHLSNGKGKSKILPTPDITNHNFTGDGVDNLGQDIQFPRKIETLDCCEEEKQKGTHYSASDLSRPKKSGKGSSSRSKDKSRREKHEGDASKSKIKSKSKSKSKIYGSVSDLPDVKPRDGKDKFQVKPDELENKHAGNKDFSGKLSSDGKRGDQLNFGGHDGPDVKGNTLSIAKQNLQNHDGERSLKRSFPEKNDQKDLRLLPLPFSGGGQNENSSRCPRPVLGNHKESEADKSVLNASDVDDALKVQKQIRKADGQNGVQQVNLRHPTPNGHRMRDHEAPSPLRRESSSHAAGNALKEAKDLKHLADRYKNTGSHIESTELYFEAVLKFLRAASIIESCNSDNGKHGEMIHAMQMYSGTAELCNYCATEFEKQRNMALSALAYKCVELAYMRVVYSSHGSANRDRQELRSALHMAPPGESPSSSASDVDNLNNLATVDKVTDPKSVGSPLVAGNHIIAAKNRPNFSRLLNFTHDVHRAMEASMKSRTAFAAANASSSDAQHKDGISSVKRALDFNFQDVEGLLRLVKLAMEAINV